MKRWRTFLGLLMIAVPAALFFYVVAKFLGWTDVAGITFGVGLIVGGAYLIGGQR